MTQFINRFYSDTRNRIGQLPQWEANVCPAQLHSLPDLQGGFVCVFDSSKTDSRTISNAEKDLRKTDGPAGLISDGTTRNAVPQCNEVSPLRTSLV